MASTKPVFVLTAGFWHTGKSYAPLTDRLQQSGYEAVALTHPSTGPEKIEEVTVDDDVQHLRNEILKWTEQGREVVVIAHSYGGIPGQAAPQGLSRQDYEKQGKKGGVIGLIFLSAFIIPYGVQLMTLIGGTPAEFVKLDKPTKGISSAADPHQSFAHDWDDAAAFAEFEKTLSLQGMLCYTTTATRQPAWTEDGYKGRLAYIRCLQDTTVPLQYQDMMMESSGQKWEVIDMDTAHSPFLNKPDELARKIIDQTVKWQS